MKSDADDDISRLPEIKIHRQCDISQEMEIDIYFNKNTIDELRQMYYSTWKPEPIKCNVAIHIRRGDVGRINNGTGKKILMVHPSEIGWKDTTIIIIM